MTLGRRDATIMPERPRKRPFGTNFHLDAFRPWLSGDKVERNLPAIAAWGFDHVRLVGDPVLPSADGRTLADPQDIVARVVRLSRKHGIAVHPVAWNLVSEEAAAQFPLVDAAGRKYARGHWGLFNFSNPELREISLRSLSLMATELAKYPDVFPYFQPTLEWQLVSYPPHGWYWPAYAGETRRSPATPVMYDADSLQRWTPFVTQLPDEWRSAILTERGLTGIEEVGPPPPVGQEGFSAHRLAWARFRASLLGDYFVDVYERLKKTPGGIRIQAPESMPLPLLDSGYTLAALGHNPEYWLERGPIGDVLAASVYDSVFELSAYPGHGDSALDHPAALMYFAELARSYGVPLAVTEQGANSYHHTEDGQRFLVMRGALCAASFDLETHSHLLWNDESTFEGVHEQFYGIHREQHLQPKPAAHELRRVAWIIDRADVVTPQRDPQVYVVVPRESMDLGLEGWTPDAIAGEWRSVSGITTSGLLAGRGLPASARVVIFAGLHLVGSAAMLQQVRNVGAVAVLHVAAMQFGTDEDGARRTALHEFTGLSELPPTQGGKDVAVDWAAGHGEATLPRTVRLHPSTRRIRTSDLPDEATPICVVAGSDQVLAYHYRHNVISAMPVGRPYDSIDGDLTRWTIELVRQTVHGRVELPFIPLSGENVAFHLIGDVLTVTNGGHVPAEASVSFNEGADMATINVSPGQFSAVQLSASPKIAVVSGPGRIVVNDQLVVENDASTCVLFDEESVRVEPLHSSEGGRIAAVTVNGIAATENREHGLDSWALSGVSSPVRVATQVERVIETRAQFRSSMTLREAQAGAEKPLRALALLERSPDVRADRHTLHARPDRAWIEWESDQDSAATLTCRYSWWSASGSASGTRDVALHGRRGRVAINVPDEYPALVRCVIEDGSAETSASLVYEAEDSLDVLVSRISDGVLRCRIIHPKRWEGFDVVNASATVLEGDTGRPARLVIGHRGMHTRHLQWSEDWVDIPG